MPRTVRLSLTVTVPEREAQTVLEEMAGHQAELIKERSATYTSLDASVEEEPPGVFRAAPGSRLFLVGPDREYVVTGLGTSDDGTAELTLRQG